MNRFFSGPNIYIAYVRLGSLGKPTLTESSSVWLISCEWNKKDILLFIVCYMNVWKVRFFLHFLLFKYFHIFVKNSK